MFVSNSLLPPPPSSPFRPVVSVAADRLLPQTEAPESTPVSHPPEARRCGIVLQRADYYTVPSVDDLDEQAKTGKDLVIQDFTVGRKMFGKVRFLGPTHVSGLNLDELGRQWQCSVCGGRG